MSKPTNQIYNPDEIYNPDVKNHFLTSQFENEDSRTTYRRIFNNSYFIEQELGRDLYTFNIDELKRLLGMLQPLKVRSSSQNGAMIRSYISWAIVEGYRDNSINPLEGIVDANTFYKQFVDQSKETLFHIDTINDAVRNSVNYQDACIVQMIFEGVLGESCSELLNLTVNDIDWDNNFLRLKDKEKDGEEPIREIPVSEECMRLIRGALNQEKYVKRNGDVSPNTRNATNDLIQSQHVLRKAVARTNGDDRGDIHLVLRRLKMISEVFELPYFTATNIRNSGMLYMAKMLLDEKKKIDPNAKLEKQEYDIISERFGISLVNNRGYITYNFYPYANDFLNAETIERIYG